VGNSAVLREWINLGFLFPSTPMSLTTRPSQTGVQTRFSCKNLTPTKKQSSPYRHASPNPTFRARVQSGKSQLTTGARAADETLNVTNSIRGNIVLHGQVMRDSAQLRHHLVDGLNLDVDVARGVRSLFLAIHGCGCAMPRLRQNCHGTVIAHPERCGVKLLPISFPGQSGETKRRADHGLRVLIGYTYSTHTI